MKTRQSKNATLSPVAIGSSALVVPDGDIGTGCLPGIGAKPVSTNPKVPYKVRSISFHRAPCGYKRFTGPADILVSASAPTI